MQINRTFTLSFQVAIFVVISFLSTVALAFGSREFLSEETKTSFQELNQAQRDYEQQVGRPFAEHDSNGSREIGAADDLKITVHVLSSTELTQK